MIRFARLIPTRDVIGPSLVERGALKFMVMVPLLALIAIVMGIVAILIVRHVKKKEQKEQTQRLYPTQSANRPEDKK